MNYFSPESRAVRVVDQLLDFLLVGILLGAPLIFYTHGHDVFEFNKITVVRVFSALAGLLYLGKLLFVRPLKLSRHALDLPLVFWLAVCLVATVHTVNWRLSFHGVYEDFEGITTWVNYVFLFYLAGQHVRSERQIRLVLGSVALAGTVMGFYGLLQNFGIDFVPWNPDTYSKTRMFSTMGNPNFLAAYCVMSMPITFALFLDLPERIHTNKAFCSVLIVLGALASAGLCALFKVNYFNFEPAFYEAASFAGMLVSQKFMATKLLLAFPLILAVLLYFGRLRWVLLLSLAGQFISTLFTKSRGGVFSIALILAIFLAAAAWTFGRRRALAYLAGIFALLLGAFAAVADSSTLRLIFDAAFVDNRSRWVLLAALGGGLYYLYLQRKRDFVPSFIRGNAAYILAVVAAVWILHFNDAIRDTTFQMVDRVALLFRFHSFKYTPRLFIWRSALAMLRDHFVAGNGLDTFQISFPPYRVALYWILEWNGTPEKAHNFFMQTAATMGFLGLIGFVWIFATFTWRSVLDWSRETDERRRLLILACFAAVWAFAMQNFFSFTVVGYGSLWWILMGFIPAMSRTWASAGPAQGSGGTPESPDSEAAPEGPWKSPAWALKAGLLFLGCSLLAALLAGPSFMLYQNLFQPQLDAYLPGPGHLMAGQSHPFFLDLLSAFSSWPLRLLGGVAGLACLGWLLAEGQQKPGWPARILFITAAVGALFFSWHSVRIWVADSFYKQGQVGMGVNQVNYAAAMYQKAAGRLKEINNDQLNAIHFAVTPTAGAMALKIEPGLNPDQELYWVKMGIAFESAASAVQPSNGTPEAVEAAKLQKINLYRTALAIHQLTLEMNPINGYNFNNKGRVLKSMGESFGDPGYFVRALEHYDRAIALDENNAYFNLDKANTLLNLGRVGEAFDLCQRLSEKFPEFAVPRSYQGFIKMRAGERKQAIEYFQQAVALKWQRDEGSKALAATNLGLLLAQEGRDAEAVQAYEAAIGANPGFAESYLNLATLHLAKGRRERALAALLACQKAAPGDPRAAQQLARLGFKP